MANVATKTVKKVAKTTTKKEVVKVSDYQKNVLNVNKALKAQNKSLGGCIKLLIHFSKEIKLSAKTVKTLRFIQKDDKAFKTFKANVRTGQYKGKSTGTYSPFYVLQAIYKAEKAENASK
tara:strand:+ start:1234 stop:1593 length:360 start_codon:yes stop_codon:yes gene_type:complete